MKKKSVWFVCVFGEESTKVYCGFPLMTSLRNSPTDHAQIRLLISEVRVLVDSEVSLTSFFLSYDLFLFTVMFVLLINTICKYICISIWCARGHVKPKKKTTQS